VSPTLSSTSLTRSLADAHTRVCLVAIDLDGTLLRSDRTVSPRTRAALATTRDAGIEIVLATARSPRSTRLIAADANLTGFAVCANGAIVYDLDADRIVKHRPLAAETAHRLVVGLRACVPGVVFGWEHKLRFGSEPAYEQLRADGWWPRPDDAYPPCDPLSWTGPMTKLLARCPNADLEELLDVARTLAGDDASATLAGDAFVELAAAGVGKEQAVAAFAAGLGIDRTRVVAFGDHLTDAAMVAWAGHGVAVANAHPAVLAAADEVTASNEEDGVAIVLERIAQSL
jgi:Cof subfamily protein (haloacid dehalogenase superfamily)